MWERRTSDGLCEGRHSGVRRDKRVVTVVLATALVLSGVAGSLGTAGASTVTVAVPASGQAYLGAFVPGSPQNMAPVDAWAADAGRAPSLVMWYQAWGGPGNAFDPTALSHVADRGAVPMVTWEPWDWQAGMSQPAYSLRNINKGRYDTFIRTWATAAKAWGRPMMLRFAHEMNATPYPWAAFTNGNTPARYIAAWRHVHDIFVQVGATNVSWVWSPSIIGAGQVGLSSVYPGSSYVNWVAADGYNGGSALSWGGWLKFGQLFNSTLDAFNTLAPGKPQMIAETASVEAGGNKAAWITQMFAALALRPQVRALVWFNQNKEADWRIESSGAAQAAFATGAAPANWVRPTAWPSGG